ncbi:MAG: 4'-phosphopantetheinyl transferase superfamily protein [Gemmatimonadetes bacterium]|nr:4-phosphopantetheinyl transferase family protein [Gemmatimonadota bacterium]NIR76844.1 4-phosphopantetheinyl transferase family protein [Gemmatimonadota bacterium]NIT85363.1 4-phosphopantetheinyl transferase family protein [Gemmatimonadota bacterium]NIU29184.1 4-phosphopantetheinyl transferase family protein [Gemmatimonadota bacterium]NIU34281.1 4'-phosphopantetheinyl transferase superfamily protein [Gemmatimonadota bacterium]
MTLVGNDVVDLRDPRCEGKSEDPRFLSRIFADDEASMIRSASPRSDRTLWLLWAAKEAAYKAVTKLLGSPPIFEHRAFRVRMDAGDAERGPGAAGSVLYRDIELSFDGAVAPDRIHVVAWHISGDGVTAPIRRGVRELSEEEGDSGERWRETLRDRFTDEEWSSVHSRASALVRILAKTDLAGTLGVDEEALEIVCPPGPTGRMPPSLRVGGRPYSGDLSLSHHGRLVAWACTVVGIDAERPGSDGDGSS